MSWAGSSDAAAMSPHLHKVKDLIASLQLSSVAGGVDVTRLSKLPYINPEPAGGLSVFDEANLAVLMPLDAGVSTPVGVYPAVLARITDALSSRLSNMSSSQITAELLKDAFYHAGCDAYIELLSRRVASATRGGVISDSQRGDLKAAIGAMRELCDATVSRIDLSLLNLSGLISTSETLDGEMEAALEAADALENPTGGIDDDTHEQLSTGVFQHPFWQNGTVTTGSGGVYKLELEDIFAIAAIVFGPYQCLSIVARFTTDSRVEFRTRAYARYALCQCVAVAMSRLSAAHAAGSAGPATLSVLRAKVLGMFDGTNDATQINNDVNTVLAVAAATQQMTAQAAQQGARLRTRVGLAADLQVAHNADAGDVARARWVFTAWLIALISVVAVASYLIASNQLTLFVVMAVPVAAVVVIDSVMHALWRRNRVSS